jgi:hypothetical protein
MANTRIYYDECRTKKALQQSTDPSRYIMNVPGNGENPCFIEDPHIIPQKWGANLMTNRVNLESELFGVNKRLNRDSTIYQSYSVSSKPILYPTCSQTITEESRAIMPAWTARDLEQNHRYILPLNPQENVCIPFQNNISTRIVEKDAHSNTSIINQTNN